MSAGQFLSLPSAATGLAPVSSATAWAFGTPVAVGTLATDIEVIFFNFQNTDIPAVDTLQEILFEITVGGTTVLQIPFSMKADSLVGWEKSPPTSSSNNFYLTEPFFIPKGSVVAIKVCDSIAAALTYNGVKILYRELSHPTTALNTPGDASSDADTTPTLNFTGTDADAALALEYQVQVDTVNTFDGVSTVNLGVIQAYLLKAASPTDDLKLEIFSESITGTSLGSVTIASADFVDNALNSFDFTGQSIVLSSNTKYYLQLTRSGARDATNYWKWMGELSDYSGGGYYTKNSGTWGSEAASIDRGFKIFDTSSNLLVNVPYSTGSWPGVVYGSGGTTEATGQSFTTPTATPLISASSTTDAGFTSGHPFASATPVDYTVQSALTAPDTYYWRVRAVRTGSTDWGDWSDIHSFDVTTGGAVVNTGFFGFM